MKTTSIILNLLPGSPEITLIHGKKDKYIKKEKTVEEIIQWNKNIRRFLGGPLMSLPGEKPKKMIPCDPKKILNNY